MSKPGNIASHSTPLVRILRIAAILAAVCILVAVPVWKAGAQYYNPTITPPAPATLPDQPLVNAADSMMMPFPVQQTVPRNYEDLMADEFAADLRTPENIKTEAQFDPATGCYVVRTRLGNIDIAPPFILTASQYNDWQMRRSMQQYFQERNLKSVVEENEKEPFNVLDMNFALGPLEKIFGPGGVQLKTQGSVQINTGVKSNFTDNPSLSINARRKTYFDFDQKIQATVGASVGNRLKFNMNYNTDATFAFDSQNLKLGYDGEEDDIVKNIEAGNVSMTTGSSLIRGSTALFGVKTKLQFGKLTVTGLVSQQNSESKSVNSRGGVQTTKFSVNADQYDQNRHYFLGQFFRDNYDRFASRLPLVSSGVNITRIEVWVTNKGGKFEQSRNLVAWQDLGECSHLSSDMWTPNPSVPNTANASNNLLSVLKSQYPDARNINTVTQTLEPLQSRGITGGTSFEKVESARLLSPSEYVLNSTLGYISIKSALNADEVLAVAYEYTYNGNVFQVGEFSSDITTTDQSLYVKMLKSTTASTSEPMWRLMMKNVYALGGYQIQKNNFKLNIKFLSDTTGTQINYLPVPGINNQSLLQVMNLDRIDSNQESNPDGFFDFIEGYTILSSQGKIIFPVAEPFGSHLRAKIGNEAIAQQYVYQELYDSTLTVARQFADKNKFILTGEYQASAGSQIRLNAMNVPRGSVIVTAGGMRLTENSDYTVDYAMGIVTITNQSIIDSGQSISVTLENQSLFSMQRKTLLGLDMQYKYSKDLTFGGTLMHFSEKALTEKVNIGDEIVSNSIFGFNLNYTKEFMWLTNLLGKLPTVNAVQPSHFTLKGEMARLLPSAQKSGSNRGSSYVDDFEATQTGIDLRSPYAWTLASTPYDPSPDALFPEAALSNNVAYGKNRALLNWYYIDRMFTSRNSSLAPSYIKSDLNQLSNPYVREVTSAEIFSGRDLKYGESNTIQTLNLSFYPEERGPYNLDADGVTPQGSLTDPQRRWGGIMRKMENTNFEQSNIEYVQFWLLNPFLDPNNPNYEGGDLYLNFGEISEDILKDGLKSYENGIPVDGNDQYLKETVWGRVTSQNSLTYSFDNAAGARKAQDVGLDGLPNDLEFQFPSYSEYVGKLRTRLSPETLQSMESDKFSPLNDPAGDNYHFYRGYDYDEQRVGILDRYKRYNGLEGNSLSPDDAADPLYQTSKATPDVEDINQDNTLNEYERYFQYRISIRPEDLVVGKNYITDKQVSVQHTRNDSDITVEWYQFKIPLADYERIVGSIKDFSTIRFARMFMTGFKKPTHLRFATLELVRGEWRPYKFNLNTRGDVPAEGQLDISVVNIEENAGRQPVNYVLPPGVTRIADSGQSQIVQLNEQSMSLKVLGLNAGDARAVYRNTQQDLRNYSRLQMWVHAESLINDATDLRSGDFSVFLRLGSDVKNNYYEYEVPLTLTPHGHYYDNPGDRSEVWPISNFLDFNLQSLVQLKLARNAAKRSEEPGVGFGNVYSMRDPDNQRNTMSVLGNPSLSDVRVLLVGVRNRSALPKDGIVWVNELKVTDFNESGGWAAKANATLNLSDVATVNAGAHIETAGFGGVDQSLNERRMDDLSQYNVAVQADLGRFMPAAVKLKAPIYYSMSRETVTPKYNPLDQDVTMRDALDLCENQQQRDSVTAYAVDRASIQNFSLSGLKFDVKSKNPMPWDPANITANFSFAKQQLTNPTTEYENTADYRGSVTYSYSPYIKPFKPFKGIKSKNKNLKFVKDWELQYLPNSISFMSNMNRHYYEQQTRSETDVMFQLPVSVAKNFLWDRQMSLTWNLTKSLNMSFNTNTAARIEETMGAVNKRLFPDRYEQWKDTVWQSIKSLGTPWSYNQSFSAQYRAPFSRIPVIDFITANAGYNSSYRWDRGARIDGLRTGNSVANQSTANLDGRLNFENIYSKVKYLREVSKRFSAVKKPNDPKNAARKPKRFTKDIRLEKSDTTDLLIKHNLKVKNVKISAVDRSGKPFAVKAVPVDENTVKVLTKGNDMLKFTISEDLDARPDLLTEIAAYASRVLMSPRSVSMRYRDTRTMNLPLFAPFIGRAFGQSTAYGPLSPGLDFAFGLQGDDYLDKAMKRGWLITDNGQTSPAVVSHTRELNLEGNIEPFKGFKVQLTMNRTDNRSSQTQFMYQGMPTTFTGSFTMTACAVSSAFGSSKAANGYASAPFAQFIGNIPMVRSRIEAQYDGLNYPEGGFMRGTALAGHAFNPENGTVSETSGDVLIPAFVAAYTGRGVDKQWLTPFPSFNAVKPNWRATFDGLINIGNLREIFRALTLTHAYQCTYAVGSYSSYLNWLSADGTNHGFILNEVTGRPIPSSPYNISSVTLTERFAPLVGIQATLKNELQLNAEYRDQRTLTLNTSAGQVVEATTRTLKLGAGYKIVGFNTILKMKGSQQGVSNDLTVNAEVNVNHNQALIRRIEGAYTQPTSGANTLGINFNANYVLSRRVTLSAYFDHQVNSPVVTTSSYPTANTSYGLSLNLSLAR